MNHNIMNIYMNTINTNEITEQYTNINDISNITAYK